MGTAQKISRLLKYIKHNLCDIATEEGYDFMQNETDIQNFYGNQTYQNLMEYLKTLHSTQAEAFVLDELHLYGSSRLGVLIVVVSYNTSYKKLQAEFSAESGRIEACNFQELFFSFSHS